MVILTISFPSTLTLHTCTWLGPTFHQTLPYSALFSWCNWCVIPISTMEAEFWIILFQALHYDTPDTSAVSHCGHASSEELTVQACYALCLAPQTQVNSGWTGTVLKSVQLWSQYRHFPHTRVNLCVMFHAFIVGRKYIVDTHCTEMHLMTFLTS